MALTFKIIEIKGEGPRYRSIVDITFDASYAAGGYTIDPKALGLKVVSAMVDGGSYAATGLTADIFKPNFLYNGTPSSSTPKLQIINIGTGAEAATNLSTLAFLTKKFICYGY